MVFVRMYESWTCDNSTHFSKERDFYGIDQAQAWLVGKGLAHVGELMIRKRGGKECVLEGL